MYVIQHIKHYSANSSYIYYNCITIDVNKLRTKGIPEGGYIMGGYICIDGTLTNELENGEKLSCWAGIRIGGPILYSYSNYLEEFEKYLLEEDKYQRIYYVGPDKSKGLEGEFKFRAKLRQSPNYPTEINESDLSINGVTLPCEITLDPSAYRRDTLIVELKNLSSYVDKKHEFYIDFENLTEDYPVASFQVMNLTVEVPVLPEIDVVSYATNSQEPYEGPLINLFDNDPNTFFHTIWSTTRVYDSEYGMWVDMEYETPMKNVEMTFQARSNSAQGIPRHFILYGRNSEEEQWTKIGEELDALQYMSKGGDSHTFKYDNSTAYKMFRFSVYSSLLHYDNASFQSSGYWNGAELHITGEK